MLPSLPCSDNGPENVNQLVDGWLEDPAVIHLKNLPDIPQHNAWSERGMAELKGAAEIEQGAVFGSLDEATPRLHLCGAGPTGRPRGRCCLGERGRWFTRKWSRATFQAAMQASIEPRAQPPNRRCRARARR